MNVANCFFFCFLTCSLSALSIIVALLNIRWNDVQWVADGSPTHSSAVRIQNLQFVPPGTNPKEFKKLQQLVSDDSRSMERLKVYCRFTQSWISRTTI